MKLKNEKKALQMFCNEDSFKDAYRQPFINDKNNGRVIASDGYIMALVDPKLLRCKYKHMEQRMPNYDLERKDFATVVEFANFDKAYNRLALIPEKVSKDGKPEECPECDGSGEVKYEYKDSNGKWVGFDTELAEAVCAKLGVTAEFVEITWDNKLIDLEAGTIDCIWNGMTITQAIKNAAEVTGAYMENGQVIVIKEGAFATPTDLAGKRIAVEGGSAGETQAKANFANSEIKTVEAQTDALLEVKSGASDACIIDLIMAKALLNSEK
jgi:hypothetical protein